jgi:hypothetical protein
MTITQSLIFHMMHLFHLVSYRQYHIIQFGITNITTFTDNYATTSRIFIQYGTSPDDCAPTTIADDPHQ